MRHITTRILGGLTLTTLGALALLAWSACTPQQLAAVAAVTGAYESAVRAQAAAAGVPTSDPAVLKAIAEAREADALAARESKAREEAMARKIARMSAAIAALPKACPACPACGAGTVDAGAGADGGVR